MTPTVSRELDCRKCEENIVDEVEQEGGKQ